MFEIADQIVIDPTRDELDSALVAAVKFANGQARKKTIKWPPTDFALFLQRLASDAEGMHGWHGGTKPQFYGGRAQLTAIWWTDVLERKHVRVLGGNGDYLCRHLRIDSDGERKPRAISTAEMLYPDHIGRVRRGCGPFSLVALCDCGAVGSFRALGWVGTRCGPCHDQYLEGSVPPRPLLIPTQWSLDPSFSFHPDGQSVIFSDSKLFRYDMRTGVTEPVPYSEMFDSLWDATFTPDGKHLILFGTHGETRERDCFVFARWEIGSPTAAHWMLPRDPRGGAYSALSPDRETLAIAFCRTSRQEGELRVHSTRDGSVLWTAPANDVDCVKFSPGGTRLIVTDTVLPTRIWDVPSGRVVSEFEQKVAVRGLTFSPDGTLLYGFNDDKSRNGWVLNLAGHLVRNFECSGDYTDRPTFDPTGRVLVAGSGEGLSFWELDSGRERFDFQLREGSPWSIKWSPDGRWLTISASVSMRASVIRFLPWPGVYEAARTAETR